ncbi:hypothetical protein [Anaeromicrobium sediminis]|uniref:Lipoprotein n=1 Tax=Anaeromicrobium sediminis TaxID=1478221 RepID=A0A267MEK7_9FIRM|nr:hypothetical protein [Anaeromicrobium sediminis]PAB57976.1 hypothetical protein CCE28_17600 [Anaeromicrobium sediminis]
MTKNIILGVLVMGILACGLLVVDSYVIDKEENTNERALKESIINKCTEYKTIGLNELTPFEWDEVYSFPPYMDKDSMSELSGIPKSHLSETYSEGTMNIIFLKDKKVVCKIIGYPKEFYLSIGDSKYEDNERLLISKLPTKDDETIVLNRYNGEKVKTIEDGNYLNEKMVGYWEKNVEEENNNEIKQKHINMVLTKDGVVKFNFFYSLYKDNTNIENLDRAGSRSSTQSFNSHSGKYMVEDDEIILKLQGDRFIMKIDFKGESSILNGEYELVKK